MSAFFGEPANLTPKQFEAEVEGFLRRGGASLSEFKVPRLEKISVADGVYEIDVTARFEALGADFLVLVECKHHRSPIKREVVQVLYDRLRAVGGQKGMIFSTAPFQSGAVKYARAHGIALVLVADGSVGYTCRAPTTVSPRRRSTHRITLNGSSRLMMRARSCSGASPGETRRYLTSCSAKSLD